MALFQRLPNLIMKAGQVRRAADGDFFSSKGPKILFVGDRAMLFQDGDLFHEIVDESGLLANAPHHERDPAVGIITDFVLLYHLVVHFTAFQLFFQLILLRHDRGQLFGQCIQFLMAPQGLKQKRFVAD